jgi:hypothetical protein
VRRSSAWSIVRVVFGLAGLAFLAVTFVRTVRRPGAESFPSWPYLMVGAMIAVLTVAFGSRGWLCLFEDGSRPALRRGYFLSQLGKYIPGGIWQAAALVTSGVRSGAGKGPTSARFPVYVLTQATAGATVGVPIVFMRAPGVARALAPLGLLMLPLLGRRWMVWFLNHLSRWTKRTFSPDLLPSQESILASYAWGIVTLLLGGAAFAVLLSAFETPASPALAVSALGAAWTVGFLALPFPSGIGIREAVLAGVIASAPAGEVVAAAIAYRLVTMFAEVILVVAVMVFHRDSAPA